MDQIFDRFGNLLRSFLHDDESKRTGDTSFSDPDLQDAWNELEDFLQGGDSTANASKTPFTQHVETPAVPVELNADYALLKSKPGAPLAEVAKSYRQLLRIHHPDRHAADPAAFAKATEKTKSLTSAFRRIKEYAETGKIK